MLNVSDQVKTIYKSDYLPKSDTIATKRNKFVFPDIELTIGNSDNSQVVQGSFSLTESISTGNYLNFGSCDIGKIEVNLANVDESIIGQKVNVIQILNEEHFIQLGTYTIDKCERTDDLIFKKIIAYDNMNKFDIDVSSWYNNIDWSEINTIKKFRLSLYNFIGIDYEDVTLCNDSMNIRKGVSTNSLNGWSVLKDIMQINGCFGHFGRDGILHHVILPTNSEQASETITKNDELKTVKFQDYTVLTIDKVKISQSTENADSEAGGIYGTGTNCYTISGNFLTYGWNASQMETAARNVSANIFNRSYKPIVSSECLGLPYVEVGDKIDIVVGEDSYSTYVLERKLCVSTMRDSFTANGNERISQNDSAKVKMEKLNQKTNMMLRTVEESVSTITEFNTALNEEGMTSNQLVTCVVQNSSGLSAEILHREEFQEYVIGKNYCDEEPIDDDDVCDDDYDIITQLQSDTQAKIDLTSENLSISFLDTVNQLSSIFYMSLNELSSTVTSNINNTSSQIQQLSNEISLKVTTTNLCNELNLSTGGLNFTGNRFQWTADNSSMDSKGKLKCRDAEISGQVTSNGIFSGDGKGNSVWMKNGIIGIKNDNQSEWSAFLTGTEIYVNQVSCKEFYFNGSIYKNCRFLTSNSFEYVLDDYYANKTHFHSDYAPYDHYHATNEIRASFGNSTTYQGRKFLMFNGTSEDENIPTIGWLKDYVSRHCVTK